MQSSKFLAMVCGFAAIGATPTALGDAPCYKDYRDTTPAERAAETAALTAIRKALPPAPTGWVINGDDQFSVTTTFCRDYEGAPWTHHFGRSYQRVDDQEARNKMIEDAGAASAAAFKLKQPRLDAIMAKQEKLVQQQVALMEKGDMVRATALNEQLAKLQDEYKKIVDEGDADEQANTAFTEAMRDTTMSINVNANANTVQPSSDAKSLAVPAGARAAFQWTTNREEAIDGHALILVGQWQQATDGSWKRVRHANAPPMAAQVYTISIQADPSRIASAVQSIDIKALAATLVK